eukprot:gene31156-37653_t
MGACHSSSARISGEKYKHQQKTLKQGDKVPNVVFKVRIRVKEGEATESFLWKDVTSADLFAKKRVAIFSIPGAFTPVCSCDHLPGYEEHYAEIKEMGIDEVYCISVNDAFVMRQWGLSQHLDEEKEDASNPLNPGNFKKVKLLPDGSAKFTRAMGMLCKYENIGAYGERSWRYSAVFRDMVIEKVFAEENGEIKDDTVRDPLLVSDAKTMLKYLSTTATNHKKQ